MFGAEGRAGSSGQLCCVWAMHHLSRVLCCHPALHPGMGAVKEGLIRVTQLLLGGLHFRKAPGPSLGHSFLKLVGEHPLLQALSGRCHVKLT